MINKFIFDRLSLELSKFNLTMSWAVLCDTPFTTSNSAAKKAITRCDQTHNPK